MAVVTTHLTLDALVPDDAVALHRVFSHPEVMASLGMTEFTIDDAQRLIREHCAQFDAVRFAPLAARLTDTGEFVGRIGLWWPKHLETVEIGWVLHPSVWGRGLATEGATAVMADARNRLGITDFVSIIGSGNRPSVAVATRLGATFRGYVPGDAGQLASCLLYEHPPGGNLRWAALPQRPPSSARTLAFRVRDKVRRIG
jgi:RimJ/RimL family protein N-acetyltransferase